MDRMIENKAKELYNRNRDQFPELPPWELLDDSDQEEQELRNISLSEAKSLLRN